MRSAQFSLYFRVLIHKRRAHHIMGSRVRTSFDFRICLTPLSVFGISYKKPRAFYPFYTWYVVILSLWLSHVFQFLLRFDISFSLAPILDFKFQVSLSFYLALTTQNSLTLSSQVL